MMPGFPNLWTIYGPNTNGALPVASFHERTAQYALQCMETLVVGNGRAMEVRPEAFWRYNRLVDQDTVAAPDWHSHEEMRLASGVYRLGIWVSHNDSPPVPGGGSCIFMHVWQGPGVPTVGCTAMDGTELEALLRWLDPRARPVLVQAPLGFSLGTRFRLGD